MFEAFQKAEVDLDLLEKEFAHKIPRNTLMTVTILLLNRKSSILSTIT